MIHLFYGHDAQVAIWVARQLNVMNFGPCVAIGIANGNQVIGGAVFNNHHKDIWGNPLSIEMSFATIDKRWCKRGIIRDILTYPFSQLKLSRVQLTIAKRDKNTRRFVERLGFKLEGIARKAHQTGTDAAVYSLLKQEWTGDYIGKKFTFSASSGQCRRSGERPNSVQSSDRSL